MALAKLVFASLQAGKVDDVKHHLVPEMQTADTSGKLQALAAYFPQEAIKSIEIMGVQVLQKGGTRSAGYSFQYELEHSWLVASVQFVNDGQLRVRAIHVNKNPASMREINAFTLKNKSAAHLFFLALSVSIPLFILVVLVLIVRAKDVPHRWRWFISAMLGVTGWSLNWTTGALAYRAMNIQLLGSGSSRPGPFAPLTITIGLPIGAIAFLLYRRRLKARVAAAAEGRAAATNAHE